MRGADSPESRFSSGFDLMVTGKLTRTSGQWDSVRVQSVPLNRTVSCPRCWLPYGTQNVVTASERADNKERSRRGIHIKVYREGIGINILHKVRRTLLSVYSTYCTHLSKCVYFSSNSKK
jgi:hypothetical protein